MPILSDQHKKDFISFGTLLIQIKNEIEAETGEKYSDRHKKDANHGRHQ